jgi:hypothetical protein
MPINAIGPLRAGQPLRGFFESLRTRLAFGSGNKGGEMFNLG